eukprot:NODE_155_length_16773_cov_0.488785.p7 type:complete len:282 gc:universal NODE_155_length_16773_cov_0.488785:6345-7190(+)
MNSQQKEDTHVIIVIGMAAAGKSATVKALKRLNPYTINLDPAVLDTPYTCNIDIRDTIDYMKLMEDYSLGPNGAIMTSLNLLCTKFHDIIALIDKRNPKYVVVDTPGQIEAFTWSASGQIIMETLASKFPVSIVYVVDSVKCDNPVSFMSNLVYACSIMYKSQLPFVLFFNKSDQTDTSRLISWMRDYDNFMEHLMKYENDGNYATDLARSMALMLEDFYKVLNVACGSALNNDLDNLLDKLEESKNSFEEYRKMRIQADKHRKERKTHELSVKLEGLDLK